MSTKTYRIGELPTQNKFRRAIRNLLMVPSWFCPIKSVRARIHRWRGVNMGKNVEIGYMTLLDNRRPELITIGDNVVVAAMTVVLTHDLSLMNVQSTEVVGATNINKGAFVGMHCTILPGVTIGEHSIVAAGAVVTRDVEPYTIVAGVPAKKIGDVKTTEAV